MKLFKVGKLDCPKCGCSAHRFPGGVACDNKNCGWYRKRAKALATGKR